MGRPAASDVSALSGCVANGRQAVHHVSSPPSKIPYGGFSPVRLQTELRSQPSLPAHTGGLCAALHRVGPGTPSSPSVWAKGLGRSETSGPEALGSPTGYSVPPGHGLLWPHPRLWAPPAGFLCGYPAGLCPRARAQSFPTFICVSFLPCRLPYPGGRMVDDCSTSIRSSLRPVRRGSALAISTQKSVHAWVLFRGCKVRFMLRPGRLLVLHRQRLLLPSLRPQRSPVGTSGITTRVNSQFPRPVFHRLDTQPCRLHANRRTAEYRTAEGKS